MCEYRLIAHPFMETQKDPNTFKDGWLSQMLHFPQRVLHIDATQTRKISKVSQSTASAPAAYGSCKDLHWTRCRRPCRRQSSVSQPSKVIWYQMMQGETLLTSRKHLSGLQERMYLANFCLQPLVPCFTSVPTSTSYI